MIDICFRPFIQPFLKLTAPICFAFRSQSKDWPVAADGQTRSEGTVAIGRETIHIVEWLVEDERGQNVRLRMDPRGGSLVTVGSPSP